MRLMFDTMDAYDHADFDRLAEIYAEDAQWRNADPNGPHCLNRDDIFAMFRHRMDAGIRVGFDELRSTPPRSCSRHGSTAPIRWSRCSASRDAASWPSRTTPRCKPPKRRSRVQAGRRPSAGGDAGGAAGGQDRMAIQHDPQRSRAAALAASRSLSAITVAPELAGWGGAWSQVASRSNSRKKS
jgi:hypothetical protein